MYNKNYLNKKSMIVMTLSFILSACGTSPVQGDKYPNIPIFPEHTNHNLSITHLVNISHGPYSLLQNDHFLYGWAKEKNSSEHTHFYIFDKAFNVVKVIKVKHGRDVLPYMDSKNGIYTYNYQSLDVSNVYRIQIPSFHQKKLSIVDMYGYNEGLKKDKKLKDLAKNLRCIEPLYQDNYIFEYTNKQMIVRLRDAQELYKYKYKCDNQTSVKVKKEAKSFAKTVLKNIDVGYYGLGFTTAFGFDYVSLTIGNETSRTKVRNRNGKTGLYIMYEDKNKIVVQPREKEDSYFIVRRKNRSK